MLSRHSLADPVGLETPEYYASGTEAIQTLQAMRAGLDP